MDDTKPFYLSITRTTRDGDLNGGGRPSTCASPTALAPEPPPRPRGTAPAAADMDAPDDLAPP